MNDTIKTALFCDCYIKYKCCTNASDADIKERFRLKYSALYELIEIVGLVEEYKAFVDYNERL